MFDIKQNIIKNKLIKSIQAQAMIEFLFMMPLLVTMLVFIYQSYVMIHKVQITQKKLKGALIATLSNQYEIIIDPTDNTKIGRIPSVFFNYEETTANKEMLFSFDDVTSSLIQSFASSKQQAKMEKVFKSFAGKEQLGVCLDSNINKELGPKVFSSLVGCK